MKIGRNAPCPCGSGEKYKKCCMGKAAVPVDLHQHRIAQEFGQLVVKLQDFARQVFGEMASVMAAEQFLSWPEAEDPEQLLAVLKPHISLFLPWFLFNWHVDADLLPDTGAKGAVTSAGQTVAAHFAATCPDRLDSLQRRLLSTIDGRPLRFFEVRGRRPGIGVRVDDMLSGDSWHWPDPGFAEAVDNGDIFLGRLTRVDDVVLNTAESQILFQPDVKPVIVEWRRQFSNRRDPDNGLDMIQDDAILDLYWELMADDEEGLSHDELINDPMIRDQVIDHLLEHWRQWVDESLPALDGQTPRQAVRNTVGRQQVAQLLDEIEQDLENDDLMADMKAQIMSDLRHRLKMGQGERTYAPRRRKAADPQRVEMIAELIAGFAAERLTPELASKAEQLCQAVARCENLSMGRGRVEIWAAAMVYLMARLNFLFDPQIPHCLSADEICAYFSTRASTTSAKAAMIREGLDLYPGDSRFCLAAISRMFAFHEDENGLLVKTYSDNDDTRGDWPVDLPPSPWKTPSSQSKPAPADVEAADTDPADAEKDDRPRQLNLFDKA